MPPERGNCDTFNTARKNVLFDNFTLFAPLIKKIMPGIPQARAMLSASVFFTTIFAGSKDDTPDPDKRSGGFLKIQNVAQCVCFYKDIIKKYEGV